jgi:hypothetical protein
MSHLQTNMGSYIRQACLVLSNDNIYWKLRERGSAKRFERFFPNPKFRCALFNTHVCNSLWVEASSD